MTFNVNDHISAIDFTRTKQFVGGPLGT